MIKHPFFEQQLHPYLRRLDHAVDMDSKTRYSQNKYVERKMKSQTQEWIQRPLIQSGLINVLFSIIIKQL
ncbi:MAG TPA: hypothetical protein DDW82_02510 [Acholeplasmataceae bacterium]|nr:hypothetical protein [Acholeplasmataceae bacterium]HCB67618.1 hypothetical protein [Acholeplasmataceae bacterium]